MIDVNDLDGLLELATDYVNDGLHFLTEPVSYGDLAILVERIIAAEKDAARYRWLRNCDTAESKKFVSESGGWIVGLGVLDGMIDEAMQCNK